MNNSKIKIGKTCQLLFLLLCFLFTYSCKKIESSITLPAIDISDMDFNNKNIELSEIADSVEYIFLESTVESYFAKIDKLLVSENHILIWDNTLKKILLFDRKGNFSCLISRHGKGPSEYIDIGDITINEEYNRIALKCDNKLAFFDLKGNFQKSIKIDLFLHYIHDFGNSFGAITIFPISQWADSCSFHFMNSDGDVDYKSTYRILPKNSLNAKGGFNSAFSYKDTLCYWECYFDTIYGLTKNNEVVPRWEIIKNNQFIGYNDYLDDNLYRIKRRNGLYNLVRILEIEGFFLFDIVSINERINILYSKSTHSRINLGHSGNIELSGFNDDIDGLFYSWPTDALTSNVLYYYENVYYLKRLLRQEGKINQIVSAKGELVKNKILSLSDMHNPIIMLIHFKHED